MSEVFSDSFTVHTYDVDNRGRASIQSLCGFLQETAGRNAEQLGVTVPQLMEHGLTWVLSRLLVRVHAYPRWWEKVVIETWPAGFHRLFALRDWRIFRGDELLAVATSAWLMVELESRRPVRPQNHGDWARRVHPERAIPLTLEKLGATEEAPADATVHEGRFSVRYRDLDMNGHANNISYIDWLLECLPLGLRAGYGLGELELNFLGEVGGGDELLSRAVAVGPGDPEQAPRFLHTLTRAADGLVAARARSRWATFP
jgi:medium-chain acyl-[acyl-carrier-protein] hydrolase